MSENEKRDRLYDWITNMDECGIDSLIDEYIDDVVEPITMYYTKDEVKSIIQSIYSEFAESDLRNHTTDQLRTIIELEVEQHPLKPIKIFK